MSDPKASATTDQVLAAVNSLAVDHGKHHTVALWLSSVVLALLLGGGVVYGVLVSQVNDRIKTAQVATDAAVKAVSDNEARIQALSDSLAAQSPSLKKTLDGKLKALGFKDVTK